MFIHSPVRVGTLLMEVDVFDVVVFVVVGVVIGQLS